jgi:hypothetical protein
MKVAFVTPRYGPQVMGGAETAARQLAEHLMAQTGWEAEAYSTCALDPHTWADELEPGDSVINGVPVHRFAAAHGRLADFYGLDSRVRLAPRLASRDQGRRWVEYNGPVSPDLIDAVSATDADVVAFYPYLYHPTVAAIGRVPVPAVLHPAAHDEPCLYLPVFRGTFGDADAFCFHTASWWSAHTQWPNGRRWCSVSAWVSRWAPAGRAERWRGWGTAPTSSVWGGWTSTRGRRCWRRSSPPTRSVTPAP